jgi:hypothetical protein
MNHESELASTKQIRPGRLGAQSVDRSCRADQRQWIEVRATTQIKKERVT